MAWQWMLRSWLQNAARQRLHEAVRQAAAQPGAFTSPSPGSAESEQPAPQRPCDVGIVFSSGVELGGMEDRLEAPLRTHGHGFLVCQGGLQGRHVVLLESGAGIEAAQRGCQALLSGHQPAWVVSAGFAAALAPEIRRGEIVMADSLADLEGRRLSIDLKISRESLAGARGVHVGKVLSVQRPPLRAAEREGLGREHQALAMDGETMAVADVCSREKVRFLAVRIVREALGDELPSDVARLSRKKSTAGRLGAALGAMVNRPSSVKDLLQQKEASLVSSDKLAKFLEQIILQLVVPQSRQTPPSNLQQKS